MADPNPSSLDLRLTPDWLKESEPANRYADFEGENADRRRGGFQRRDRRDEGPGRRRGPDDRQRRPLPDRRTAGGPRPPQADQRHPGHAPAGTGGQRFERSDRNRFGPREEARPAPPPVEPAPVQVDFLPEERAFAKIIQQIKSGHIAYPLFGLARMFLERPERHRVRIRSQDNGRMLYQFGDHGPVAMDPAALERIAFSEHKDEFYETEVIEKEPIKGNFTSVARCTLSGRLLGPTNYHTFQPLVRSLYEQRFSRRMSFEDYRRTIDITTDPEVVNQWKEEARKSVIYKTKGEQEPVTFDNLAAVEQHFRTHHLASFVKPCLAAEISGELARHLPDRGIVAAIRVARDRENRFPAQIAGALRHGLNQAGLHVFKHKKRILYISTVRPQPFNSSQTSLSAGLAAVLSALRSYPKITRKQLAEKVLVKVLGQPVPDEASPEYQHAKTALAGDLIWLAKAGHVIEFADGTLDLPLPPKSVEDKAGGPAAAESTAVQHGSEELDMPEDGGPENGALQADQGATPAAIAHPAEISRETAEPVSPSIEAAEPSHAGQELPAAPAGPSDHAAAAPDGAHPLEGERISEPAAQDHAAGATGPQVTAESDAPLETATREQRGEAEPSHPEAESTTEAAWATANS